MTALTLKNKTIYFSYQTPVMIEQSDIVLVTDFKHSKTTSSHINQFLESINKPVKLVPQDIINQLAEIA